MVCVKPATKCLAHRKCSGVSASLGQPLQCPLPHACCTGRSSALNLERERLNEGQLQTSAFSRKLLTCQVPRAVAQARGSPAGRAAPRPSSQY